ncbi:hypothetical protein PV396_43625 [Streptomyces sp. ME02-8801-2C]|uniref:hypothetical protein n=1 Tax=Streptomyces sp. ME02-8801-2C TaxID=3028680 RepID=UPI0029B1F276|nr:hypothetical protein [Streptomyces sp. ME02-8801-2C]MDX3458738.1 hypothetical protein [Streptomyces sp. ME02-8801-2C]
MDGKGFNVLTVVLAILALALGGVSVYYARRSLFPPKRRLSYELASASPLVDRSGLQPGSMTIEVLCNGAPLTDPHLAVVRLRNSGRHAIASEQFDQQRALEIVLNASVVELLSAEAEPGGTVVGACVVSGGTISFGPELITKGQEIILTALVEGAPVLEVRDHFVDVQLRAAIADSQAVVAMAAQRLQVAAGAAGLAGLVAALTSFLP